MKKRVSLILLLLAVLCILPGCRREPRTPNENSGPIVNIVDFSKYDWYSDDEMDEPFGLEWFLGDDGIERALDPRKHMSVIVIYDDGTTEFVGDALRSGRATFDDLDKFGIEYYTSE